MHGFSDDFVRVFDLAGAGLDTEKGGKLAAAAVGEARLRHDNQTGRWLTNFRATWCELRLPYR